MRIAYIIFDGITWLDLIGVYEPISKLKSNNFLPDLNWDICGYTAKCKDVFGFEVNASTVQNDLSHYDAIIVPGGMGTRQLQHDETFITWLKTAAPVKYKISICTGSLLLGAAGFLKGKKATTNFQEYEALKPYCNEVLDQRIVEDDDTITAGAVSSSIDLGLYLCRKWAGDEAEKVIRRKIDYHG
ncbi:MAG: DJ/PfpI family protein [Segetibacter sp.]|nr:DJ/PfpI family protein [Segetibacter sp.]